MRKRQLLALIVMGAALFLSAGRLSWWNGWLYIGIYLLAAVGTGAVLIRHDPDLIAERVTVRKDAKSWDKWLASIIAIFGPIAVWITAGLEARHRGPENSSAGAAAGGAALMIAGSALVFWAMLSNTFFSALVRIQKERGHRVVDGGPYRYVRHPGYAGIIATTVAGPLVLNSLWAFVPAGVTVAVTLLRTVLEDRTLRGELEGYADYTHRVRYRLLPGLW